MKSYDRQTITAIAVALAALLFVLVGMARGELPCADLYDAIRLVESAGDDNAIGDGGASVGPYQISPAYWRDGAEAGGVSNWDYHELVRSRPHAEYIIYSYWCRWCFDALQEKDYETLARIHNGGPNGHWKTSTLKYWRKVKAELEN